MRLTRAQVEAWLDGSGPPLTGTVGATMQLLATQLLATMDALEAERKVRTLALEGLLVVFNAQGLDGPGARKMAGEYLTKLHDAELALTAARKATEESVCDNCNRNNGGECSKAEVGKREYCPAREATGGTDETL